MKPSAAPRPSLAALRIFLTAAEHRSLAQAAMELNLTPSAVSHAIRGLERQLGASLIQRGTRPFALTSLGTQYVQRLGSAFAQIHEATETLFNHALPHQVTVTTYPLFAVKWLAPRLHSLYASEPNLDVTLISTNRMLDLKSGEADLAIRLDVKPSEGCRTTRFMEDQAAVVGAPALLRGRRRNVDLLRTLPLIATDKSARLWRRWLRHNGVSGADPSTFAVFDDALAATEAAVAGVGLTLTLRSLVEDDLRRGRLVEAVPSSTDLTVTQFLVVPEKSMDRPAVKTLMNWLASVV